MPWSKRHGKIYLRKREYIRHRKRQLLLFIKMLNAYGTMCACCGESEPDFLTLDHKNNNGAKDRRANSQSYGVYMRLNKRGWPKEDHQVLCMNCNWAKRRTGFCSHKQKNMRKYILNRDGVLYLSEQELKHHYLNGKDLRKRDLRLRKYGAGLVNGLLRILPSSQAKLAI